MRRSPLVQMVVVGVIASVILILIVLLIPWFPAEGSIQSGNVQTLYDVLLIVSVPIFVLVETVVMFSVMHVPHAARPGARGRAADPRQHPPRGHLDGGPRRC